jgi:hypothetical protein
VVRSNLSDIASIIALATGVARNGGGNGAGNGGASPVRPVGVGAPPPDDA